MNDRMTISKWQTCTTVPPLRITEFLPCRWTLHRVVLSILELPHWPCAMSCTCGRSCLQWQGKEARIFALISPKPPRN